MTNDELDALEKRAIDDGAKAIAKWIGYSWEGLSEGRITDRGFPVWTWGGQFEKCSLQGGHEDLRDIAREVLSEPLASLRRQLAEKEADIERLTRERDDAKLLAQNNLDWFNLLKPDFDTAIRQRDTLKDALVQSRHSLRKDTGMAVVYWPPIAAALDAIDQPDDAAEG